MEGVCVGGLQAAAAAAAASSHIEVLQNWGWVVLSPPPPAPQMCKESQCPRDLALSPAHGQVQWRGTAGSSWGGRTSEGGGAGEAGSASPPPTAPDMATLEVRV